MAEEINNIIRIGKVSSVDGKTGTARVVFPDRGNMVSYDLPVIVPQTLKNKDYIMPDIGEQVVCVFLPNGIQMGFIVGSIYSEMDKPKIIDPDKRRVDFADGTWIEYDRKTNALTVNSVGSIEVTAPRGINITAAQGIKVSGDIDITGNLKITGSLTAGGVSCAGDIVAAGKVTWSAPGGGGP